MNLHPSEIRLAHLLGMTPEQMAQFKLYVSTHAGERPAVTAGFIEIAWGTLLVNALIAGAAFVASRLLAPGPTPPGFQFEADIEEGNTRRTANRFSPTSAITSAQDPATEGSPVPLVYANQEVWNGELVGGVRVNMPMLWSQIESYSTYQRLRALFLLGEAEIEELDPLGFAFGETLLTDYDLGPALADAATWSIYFNRAGGRTTPAMWLTGRQASEDPGNATNQGAPDLLAVRAAGTWQTAHSMASTPNGNTTFGLFDPILQMGYRVNPRLRPTETINILPSGSGFRAKVKNDSGSLASLWKSVYHWSGRSGIISTDKGTGRVSLDAGDEFVYVLNNSTDAETTIFFEAGSNTNTNAASDAEEELTDVAGAVASRQQQADSALVVGSLYRAGSCHAVLLSRSPADRPFISDASNEPVGNGNRIEFTFRVVKAGVLDTITADYLDPPLTGKQIEPEKTDDGGPTWDELDPSEKGPQYPTCTSTSQIFRLAVGHIAITRPAKTVEIGIVSQCGIQVNGLCNFRSCQDMGEINQRAINDKRDGEGISEDEAQGSIFQSGTVSQPEKRYSFWKLYYRRSATDGWNEVPYLMGVADQSQRALSNFVRFTAEDAEQWEFMLDPISGWELRSGQDPDPFIILDTSTGTLQTLTTKGKVIEYLGEPPRSLVSGYFRLSTLEPRRDLYIHWTESDDSMIDEWGRLAEAFVYDEITSSVSNGPEHRISYVNIFQEPDGADATYEDLSQVVLSVGTTTELQSLSQFSADVLKGRRATHLFPEILEDILLNDRFGLGLRVRPEQIDQASFQRAAAWCQQRGYFFDGAISTPANIRQWAADTAAAMLLRVGERGGQWYLEPALIDGPVPINALFTAGNVAEGTFRLNRLPVDQTRPPIVAATWRRRRRQPGTSGVFPFPASALVSRTLTSTDAPVRALDMQAFVTRDGHAIDAAKFAAREVELGDHTISFEATYDIELGAIQPDSYIRVAMERTFHNKIVTGAVLADGSITSHPPLADGSYTVLAWQGFNDVPAVETTLTVKGGRGDLVGQVFAVADPVQQVRTYRVTRVRPTQDGRVAVEAVHAPVDENGQLLLVADWDDASAWRILR